MINNTRNTYFPPYDDAQAPLLAVLTAAKSKVRLMDYSYNLEPVTDALIALHNAGVDVQLVLDKSQSVGSTEEPQIAQLKAANVPLVIGTSDEHQIMHNKVIVVDDEITVSGSYNFTGTADKEDNFMDVEYNTDRAAAFTKVWQEIHDWIAANEGGTNGSNT